MNDKPSYIKLVMYRPDGTRLGNFEGFPDVEAEECLLSDEKPPMLSEPFIESILGTKCWEYDICWKLWGSFKNFNPPKRWKPMQDKRKNTAPLGTDTYIRKAKEMKNLARGTKPHKSDPRTGLIQCKHTFEITKVRCAACDGYDLDCEHYEKTNKGAADTKHLSR